MDATTRGRADLAAWKEAQPTDLYADDDALLSCSARPARPRRSARRARATCRDDSQHWFEHFGRSAVIGVRSALRFGALRA